MNSVFVLPLEMCVFKFCDSISASLWFVSTSTTGMPSPRVVLGVQTGLSNLCPVGGRSIFLLQLRVQVMTSPEDVLLCNRKSGALRAQ